jgi:prevent-host-death family protein
MYSEISRRASTRIDAQKAVFPDVEITPKIAYYQAMKIANIAELKNRLSEFLALVEQGEEIEIRKRNIAIARVIPLPPKRPNATRLDSGAGTVRIRGDLTEPLISESDWGMLRRSRR